LFIFAVHNRGSASQENTSPREPAVASRPAQAVPTEYRLTYKFRPNQDVRMLKVFASQMRVQKGGRTDVSAIQSATERHYHVASVDPDGSAVLDLTIDNVKIVFSVNGASQVTYDTRGHEDPPPRFETVKDCIGKHAQVRVDTRGRVSATDNSQSSTIEDRDFLAVLPEKPVKIGDEWFDDYPVHVKVTKELSQKVTLRRRYKLTAVNNNVAIIHVEITELTPINDPQVLAGLVPLTPKGTVLLDLEQGTLTLRDLHCDRTEIGVLGPASSIAGVTSTRETLR
jgi:ribosomal protein L21